MNFDKKVKKNVNAYRLTWLQKFSNYFKEWFIKKYIK